MVGWSVSIRFNAEEKNLNWMQVTGSHLDPLLVQLVGILGRSDSICFDGEDMVVNKATTTR